MKIDIEYTTKKFNVPSLSEKGTYRKVELTNKGRLFCDCPAGFHRKSCRHTLIVEKYLNDNSSMEKNIPI